VFSRTPTPATPGGPGDDHELTPEEEEAYRAGIERIELEKERALANPGPSWSEWFYYDAAKWWIGLGFLIVDAWVGGAWFTDGAFSSERALGAALCLGAAFYVEFLIARYLWRRPSESDLRRPGPFRPGWTALREVGRWTPEAARRRAHGGGTPYLDDGTPRPDEFL
jgi:hypothetical protein